MNINESTYSDYIFLISPSAEIKEMVRKYKLSCAKVIGDFDGKHGIAHISVTKQHRQMPVEMMQKLNCYQKKLRFFKPAEMRVNGFSYFTHGNLSATIYAKIELDAAMNSWFTQMKRVFGDSKKSVPHVTIAKNIPVDLFKTLWPYFVNRQYKESFDADRVIILSRPMIGGSGHQWNFFKELYFRQQA
jgi:2'-5' RNA ligase